MKRSIILFVVLFFANALLAQTKAIDKATDSTCKCITAAKDKIKSAAGFDKLGTDCIASGTLPYLADISKEENIPVEDIEKDNGYGIGQKIGVRLMVICPSFRTLMTQYGMESDEEEDSLMGIVANVEFADNVYISVKDAENKIFKFVWLEYFEGADAYKSNLPALKGKMVAIGWKEVLLYNAKKKDFMKVKQITSLEIQ